MKIKVNKDMCSIEQNEIWNVGDYNVHTVEVDLSSDFDGLVNKVRYFVDDKSYDMLIVNNIAQVPYEATLQEGAIKIGVYGYDADTDILVQSTSPIEKYISSGSYTGNADNTEPLTPTDKEQMESQIQANTNDIIDLKANKQDKLISGVNIKTINNESILSGGNLTLVTEETDPIFTNSPAYSITDEDITYWNNKANVSDIPDVSNFITKDVDNLTYYTKSTDMQNSIDSAVNTEKVARENADVNLQNQIDAITVSSDVIDILGTYQDLQNYDTSHVKANDIIKILQDSTHNDAMSYYRWVITDHVGAWVYVGSEGPYYTKSESDTLLNAKQNEITSSNMLASDLVDDTNQTNQFVTTTEKTTWNNKLDQSDLTNYVTNTDYATKTVGGVIKVDNYYDISLDSGGALRSSTVSYNDYLTENNGIFISKGTLNNVITGKNLETSNNKVVSISSESTDKEYPSAKCVYDNDVMIKDDVNTKYDYLFSLTNLFGKIIGTGTSVTLNDTSDTIMKLNLDTTPSSQQGTPSPSNPQTIHTINGNNDININNKNLYHMQSATPNSSASYTINSNNSIRVYNTSSSWRRAYTELTVPAGDYAFSFQSTVVSGAKQVIIQKVIDGTATDFKTMTITNETTFTLDSETLLRFVFYSTTGTNEAGDVTYSNIQLENNTSVTSFEPYKQQTYPINLGDIELCKIGDYQDVLFKNTMDSEYYDSSLELNKWYLKKNVGKVVLDGSESIARDSTSVSGAYRFLISSVSNVYKNSGNDDVSNIYCNKLIAGSITSTYIAVQGISYGKTTSDYYREFVVYIDATKAMTKDEFKTWLSTHNLIVYYVMATPNYTLLNDTLQTQLDSIQYALAYDTQTNISQTNNDLPFIINAETFAKIGG